MSEFTATEQHEDKKISVNDRSPPSYDVSDNKVDMDEYRSAGVLRVEAIARAGESRSGRHSLYLTALLIWIMTFVYTMQSSTTYSYSVWATSSFASHSSGLAILSIASSLIGAVSNPFIAKLCDVFNRPYIYLVSLICYVVGFIMILKSPNLATYIVGNVVVAIGSAALSLITTILTADLISLKWRAFAQGMLSAPYIVTPWFTGLIVEGLSNDNNWRWGYGMYAIILPVVMAPAIAVLIWLDHRAHAQGLALDHSAGQAVEKELGPKAPLLHRAIQVFHELDTFGLLLLGFGWSLLLLPFSLSSLADGGYSNQSLIAMFVVGALCLIFYVVFEVYWAKYPSSPKRLLMNKTFMTAVIIDVVYMVAGYLQLLYLPSYAYIVTDWSDDNWTYYNNTLSIALCLFGVIGGLLMRVTHRYKGMQLAGLVLKVIGYALTVDKNGVRDTARLVISQVFVGAGGAFSVMGNQVSAQACVPHQDVALSIALLLLWSSIGASIGSAASSAIWANRMPGNLREFMPSSVNDTMIETFFGDITVIKSYDFDSEIRQAAILAYEKTVYPMWAAALGLSFLAIAAACFQTNFYLDDRQNCYDGNDLQGRSTTEGPREGEKKESERSLWQRFASLFYSP